MVPCWVIISKASLNCGPMSHVGLLQVKRASTMVPCWVIISKASLKCGPMLDYYKQSEPQLWSHVGLLQVKRASTVVPCPMLGYYK